MSISVLLSIYRGTDRDEFVACLDSIKQQSLLPDQVVVVVDGPVDNSVDRELASFESYGKFDVDVIRFSENRGLGAALADGLSVCQHDLVARVDTDDISVANRLEIQQQHMTDYPEISVIGGLLEEQYIDGDHTVSLTRPIPLSREEINRKSRYRNPLDHPTVMFRRKDVLAVGSYQTILGFEDYYLWARLINNGYIIENLNIVLVRTTADEKYFIRRGGVQYLKQEIALAGKFRDMRFHDLFQSCLFLTTRILVRLLPNSIRRWTYAKFLRYNLNESGVKS